MTHDSGSTVTGRGLFYNSVYEAAIHGPDDSLKLMFLRYMWEQEKEKRLILDRRRGFE